MKGTAARTGDAAADALSCAALESPKNRAENVMIVDLLRNDLGRVAEVGSVCVPQLFDLETYPSVFQLTSTVTARLPVDCGFPAVLRALFPCGSVTGAPKHHTMELIAELETEPRGLYCGAIGWIDAPPEGTACGDFCLSVAIRTLTLEPAVDGLRQGRLGIGAGIVMDSDAASEHAECETKARFLTGLGAGFSLIETMFATKAGGIRYLEKHLARLSASALRLGFRYDQADVIAALDELVGAGHARDATADWAPIRVRLLLHENGECELTASPLPAPLAEPVVLIVAPDPLDPHQLLLGHKTTQRRHYDDGLALAEQAGAFDALFFNTRGELTEGARTNVFLRLDGTWQTPALSCGVLPGVMRSVLLEDRTLNASESILTHADLLRAEEILVCNALRGRLRARLIAP
jgi:para-aminobenzoate synthetase/4-amino-4-deoxychorismate lyase